MSVLLIVIGELSFYLICMSLGARNLWYLEGLRDSISVRKPPLYYTINPFQFLFTIEGVTIGLFDAEGIRMIVCIQEYLHEAVRVIVGAIYLKWVV